MEILDLFYKSLFVLFIIIDPIGYCFIFSALTTNFNKSDILKISLKATLISYIVIILFLIFGKILLDAIHIKIEAMKIVGGLALLKTGYSIVYDNKNNKEYQVIEDEENQLKNNIIIYPLAMGILSGPGTLSTIVIISDSLTIIQEYIIVIISITIIYTVCFIGTILLNRINNLNNDIIIILNTIIGILLSSLAITFIINGIKDLVDNWDLN